MNRLTGIFIILPALLLIIVHEDASATVTGLEAFFRSGQTFITWELVDDEGISYNVYRSEDPIMSAADLLRANKLWEVADSAVINARKTISTDTLYTYCIEDLSPLPYSKGLYVHTAETAGEFYYAVTSIHLGEEDTSLILGEGGNSLSAPIYEETMTPHPILQYEGTVSPGIPFRDYVHWGSEVDTDSIPAMASYPSYPYNFRVWNVPQDSSAQILRFFLHSGDKTFTQRSVVYREGVIVCNPDCPEGTYPLLDLKKTYWFGYNSNLGYAEPLIEGVNVNYHERRLLYYKNWAVNNLNVDPDAVLYTGSSYGACGSIIMSLAHPEEISAIQIAFPKLDFGDSTFGDFDNIVTQWGYPEEHIQTTDSLDTYQRLNAAWMIECYPARDFPIMTMFFGKYDSTMGWSEKVAFMNKAQEMRVGGIYFWDTSTHNSGRLKEWQGEFLYQYNRLFRYRTDQSYPAVSDLSINDDPGDGDPWTGDSVGTYGGYVDWIPETIVEEPNRYEISMGLATRDTAITLPADTATATITLKRLQKFQVNPASIYHFMNVDTTTQRTIQTMFIRPDSHGRLSAEGVFLSVNGHRLSFSRAASYMHYDVEARDSISLSAEISYGIMREDYQGCTRQGEP